MPLAGQPGLPAPEDTQVATPTTRQNQEGANALEDVAPDTDPLAGIDLSGPKISDNPGAFESEDDELLFGPTTRPDDRMGNSGRTPQPLAPRNIERNLPYLIEAARQPGAPPELVSFVRILAYHLGRQL